MPGVAQGGDRLAPSFFFFSQEKFVEKGVGCPPTPPLNPHLPLRNMPAFNFYPLTDPTPHTHLRHLTLRDRLT